MHLSRRTSFRALITFIGLVAHTARAIDTYTEFTGSEGDGEITVGPEYSTDKDLTDLGAPKGKAFEFTMKLADSKIFRGDDKTLEPDKKAVRTERKISVYIPAAYQDGTAAPLWTSRTTTPRTKRSIRSARGNTTPA